MNLFFKIAIFCATIILLLHSFVSHNHQHNNNETFYSESKSLTISFNFLSKAISLDLGENHLTNFFIESIDFDNTLECHSFSFFFFKFQHNNKEIAYTEYFSHSVFNRCFYTEFSFRGPPSI